MKFSHKPTLIISKCLRNNPCRYDGSKAFDKNIDSLKNFVNFIEVCPEVEIGLNTPRDPIRLVQCDNKTKLLQLKTSNDYTKSMTEFGIDFIDNILSADGFILKSRSPSCGIKDVKVYPSIEKCCALNSKGTGIFADSIKNKFINYPIEDEGRLKNYSIRSNFLTRIFLLSKFRYIKTLNNLSSLIDFHNNNNLLLMSYSQKGLKELETIISDYENSSIENILDNYEEKLLVITNRTPRYTSKINVMLHALDCFSSNLTHDEKEFTLELIDKYKNEKVPLSVPLNIIKGDAIRFNNEYLLNQSFFTPYPEELLSISDSGKGVVH